MAAKKKHRKGDTVWIAVKAIPRSNHVTVNYSHEDQKQVWLVKTATVVGNRGGKVTVRQRSLRDPDIMELPKCQVFAEDDFEKAEAMVRKLTRKEAGHD